MASRNMQTCCMYVTPHIEYKGTLTYLFVTDTGFQSLT